MALHDGEWSASWPSCFTTSVEKAPVLTHWIRGWAEHTRQWILKKLLGAAIPEKSNSQATWSKDVKRLYKIYKLQWKRYGNEIKSNENI
jgi:hypothetical protein